MSSLREENFAKPPPPITYGSYPASVTHTHTPRETPEVILSVAAEHDVQLVLSGALPEGHMLGGPILHTDLSPLSSSRGVTLKVSAGTAAELVSAGRCLLRNQEFVPLGHLTVVETIHDGPGNCVVHGTITASRSRQVGLIEELRADLPAPGGGTVVLGLARPPTREDEGQLTQAFADRNASVLILVGGGSSSGDELGPEALDDVAHALVADWDLGSRAFIRHVPVIWRDVRSDRMIIERIAKMLDAACCVTLLPGADDPGAESWRRTRATDLEGHPLDSDTLSPAVAQAILRWDRPRAMRGLVVMLTGLSGSGKSTLAKDLATRICLDSKRAVTLLDGDLVRQLLSSDLGFDRESRELNVRRIGFVAAEVARHGGTTICAPIAPYASGRSAARELVRPWGDFVLVHVATPLEECERRDRKGLYAKARAGLIQGFTGISDPYEYPEDADLRVDTSIHNRQEAVELVMQHLRAKGLIPSSETKRHGP